MNSYKDLINVIVPFFEKNTLLTQKKADFLLFTKIVDLMGRKEHLTKKGLEQIVNFRASMNNGLTKNLKVVFPDANPSPRPKIQLPKSFDPHWISGFTSAEGCFLLILLNHLSIN